MPSLEAPATTNRTGAWRAPLAIAAWSLLVHLPGITAPLLDYHAHRQCQTASMSRDYFRHGMRFLKPEIDTEGPAAWAGTEFPLYSYAVACLYKLFGLHEALGRLFSAALTAGSALFLYGWVRARLDERAAFWSAFAMCAIPVHIYFTRTFQPESMALWSFLGFLYYLDRWLYRGGGAPAYAAALVMGATGPLLKLSFFYLVGGLWLVLGWESRRLRRPLYLLFLGAIMALTWSWYAYARRAPLQILPLSAGAHEANLRAMTSRRFWTDHFISRLPEICFTYSGLALTAVGAVVLWRRRERFWFAWWMMTAFYTVLLGEYGWIHKYTDIPWAPVNGVFIAAGGLALWEKWRGDPRRCALLALLVVGIPVHAFFRIKHWYRLERLWLFQARRVVDAAARPEDLVLTNTAEEPVLHYYLDRCGWVINLDSATRAQVEAMLARPVRFFVTPTEGSWTRHPEWIPFFNARARLLYHDADCVVYAFPASPKS